MNFSPILKNREFIKAITPALRYKNTDDLASWQAEARAKLSELLGLQYFTKCDPEFEIVSKEETASYTEYCFKIKSEDNFFFTSTIRVPVGKAGKIPVAICLKGHSDDLTAALSDNAELDRNMCTRALAEGYCAVAVETRNFNECFSSHDIIPEEMNTRVTWCACYRSSMRALMLGRTTIGERVWDVMRVIDALVSNFDFIDENAICLIGNAGGATAAYYAAAIDERIAAVAVSGGVCSYEHSIIAANHCICNYIPNVVNYFEMGDVAGLIAPRGLSILTGNEDVLYPLEGVESAFELAKNVYSAANVADKCKLSVLDEANRFYADAAWADLHEMVK